MNQPERRISDEDLHAYIDDRLGCFSIQFVMIRFVGG